MSTIYDDVSRGPCDDQPEYLWRNDNERGCDWVGRPNKKNKDHQKLKTVPCLASVSTVV